MMEILFIQLYKRVGISRGPHLKYEPDKNEVFQISIEDWRLLLDTKPILMNCGYVKVKGEYLHRLIKPPTDSLFTVDHLNKNKRDNTRDNLRVVLRTMQQLNRIVTGEIPYRGVFKDKRKKAYRARLSVMGKDKYFGSHSTPELAAKAVDAAIRLYYPTELHLLNFPNETN